MEKEKQHVYFYSGRFTKVTIVIFAHILLPELVTSSDTRKRFKNVIISWLIIRSIKISITIKLANISSKICHIIQRKQW